LGTQIQPSEAGTKITVNVPQNESKRQLTVFGEDGILAGRGEYTQSIPEHERVRTEIKLDLGSHGTLRQVVVTNQNKYLHPISYFLERVNGSKESLLEVDFKSGQVKKVIKRGTNLKNTDQVLAFDHESTFAGAMFIIVALNFPQNQAELDLQSVIFSPKPKVVKVKMKEVAVEKIQIKDRMIPAVKYVVSPSLPFPVNVFVGNSHNHTIWLSPEDRTFLRFEGSLEINGHSLRIE
jgi:hypothetical protein